MRVTLIQGGGIGYDQVPAVKRIVEAAGATIAWDIHVGGGEAVAQGLDPLPPAMLDSVRTNGLALKTKFLPVPGKTHVNFNVLMRRALGLFAAVRPLKNIAGLPARFTGVDMLVLRELTEDLYTSIEHEIVPGVVQSIKVVTDAASRRFFRFAFDYARSRPQDDPLRPQGEHPQAGRRPVSRCVSQCGEGVSRGAAEGDHRR